MTNILNFFANPAAMKHRQKMLNRQRGKSFWLALAPAIRS